MFLIGLIFQMELLPNGTLPFSARLYYLSIPIVYLVFFGLAKSLRIPSIEVFFLSYLLTFCLITVIWHGLNTSVLLAILCYFVFRVGVVAGKRISAGGIEELFNFVFFLLLVFYIFRFFFNLEEYMLILESGRYQIWDNKNGGYTTKFLFLTSGGWNAEIALIGVLLPLIRNSKLYRWNLLALMGHVVLFQSRIGVIIVLMHLCYLVWTKYKRYRGIAVTFFIILVLVAISFSDLTVFGRFGLEQELSLQDEGRTGRLMLWFEGMRLLGTNFLGYGPGVSIEMARLGSVIDFTEPNFHNIYLQVLLDLGVIGFLLFIVVIIRFSIIIQGEISKWNFSVLIYAVVGLFQFTGYDVFIWFVIGVISSEINSRKRHLPLAGKAFVSNSQPMS
jgi:O-antigen ligase